MRTSIYMCICVYTWLVLDRDVPRFCMSLVRVSAQAFLSFAWYIHAASTIYRERERERERERKRQGDQLMRAKNLLPSSQYYNYSINDSHYASFYGRAMANIIIFSAFSFRLFLFSFLMLLILSRLDIKPSIKMSLSENISLEFG